MTALGDLISARFSTPQNEAGVATYYASGDWCMAAADALEELIDGQKTPGAQRIAINLSDINVIDTAGALMFTRLKMRWEQGGAEVEFTGIDEKSALLLRELAKLSKPEDGKAQEEQPISLLEKVGSATHRAWRDVIGITALTGAFALAVFRRIIDPSRFRPAAIVTHANKSGLSAVPIISLMSFLIGAIIAQQGAYQLEFYGAGILAVDFVGVLVTRDLGVLLTAIMVAGRSGSAYTAELGSMKMREEIDAMKVMGIDPVEILVTPRVLGLIIALPILTIIADIVALLGAMLASWAYIGLSFDVFLERLREAVTLPYFMLGLIKAPFMALIIGLIACSEGFKVQGNTESLGNRTTVSVVKSIFMVILVDGIFAILSASLGY